MSERYEPNQEFEKNLLDQEFGEGTTDFIKNIALETINKRLSSAAETGPKNRVYDDPALKKHTERELIKNTNYEQQKAGQLVVYYKAIFGSDPLAQEDKIKLEQTWQSVIQRQSNWFSHKNPLPTPVAENAITYFILAGKKRWSQDDETKIIEALDEDASAMLTRSINEAPKDSLDLGEGLRRSDLLEAAQSEAFRVLLTQKTERSQNEINIMLSALKNLFSDRRLGIDDQLTEGWKTSHKEDCLRFAALYTILKRAGKK